jgi:hypothetical protein
MDAYDVEHAYYESMHLPHIIPLCEPAASTRKHFMSCSSYAASMEMLWLESFGPSAQACSDASFIQ